MATHGTWHDWMEIINLQGRYFRCLDTKDWDGFADVFTPEAEWRGGNYDGVMRGAAAITSEIREILGDATTVHYGHTPEIEFDSPGAARGVWAAEEHVWWPDGSRSHNHGHYFETFAVVGGSWRIASVFLTRIRGERIGESASDADPTRPA